MAYRQPVDADGQNWDPSSPLDDDATKADDAEVTASWGDGDTWTIAGFTYKELRQLLKEQKGHRCCPSGAGSKGVSHRRTSDACRIDWPTRFRSCGSSARCIIDAPNRSNLMQQ